MHPFSPRLRRLGPAAVLLLAAAGTAAPAIATTAAPAPVIAAPARGRPIDVVQLTGPLDPVSVDLALGALRRSRAHHAEVVIFQVDSRGSLDSNASRVWRAVARSSVPVAVWVGPSGAQARGAAAFLLQAAAVAAIAPGTHAGPAVPTALGGGGSGPGLARELRALAARAGRSEDVAEDLALHKVRLNARDLAARHAVDVVEPTLGSVIVALDGRRVTVGGTTHVLHTARVVKTAKGPRQAPLGTVSFVKLGLGGRVQHSLAGPSVALLFFVLGLCLVAFEFFAASVGLAGTVGALALVAAFFGFSHLPIHGWAAALIVAGALGFCVDVQAATTGIWTIFGTLAVFAGGATLYRGGLNAAVWQVLLLTTGVVLFFVGGVASVVRARFSTPTVGRESMIGEMGEARAAVDPDGVVSVRGALWRARTNRATPIAAGGRVRVVAVDGLVLEVEPETGGARDAGH